jgi:hypothetical protein
MPRRTRTHGAVCALAVLGLLTVTGEAAAQSDGVFVDPDTPAGKEYALPLDRARQDVAPNSGAQGSEPGNAELFGAGISKRDGGGGSGERGGGESGASNGQRGEAQGGSGVGTRSVAQAAASSGSGISAGWLTVLIAFGVLVVGGIAGLSLRALRSS